MLIKVHVDSNIYIFNITHRSPMEDSEYKKEYDDLLAVYSNKKGECQQLQRQIGIVKTEIEELKNKIRDWVPPPPAVIEPEEHQVRLKEQLQQEQQSLNDNLHALQSNDQDDPEIQSKRDELKVLEDKILAFVLFNNSKERNEASQLFERSKITVNEKSAQLARLEKELEGSKQHQSNIETQIQKLSNEKAVQNNSDFNDEDWEKQLKQLQEQQAQISKEIDSEKQRKLDIEKQLQVKEKALKDDLANLQGKNSKSQSTLKKLEGDLQKIELPKPKKNLDDEIKNIEDSSAAVNKEIDALTQQLAHKKEQLIKIQKEESVRKVQKRNFKKQVADEKITHQILDKDRQRDIAKLQNQIKMRKTYVSQQNLQILQKELERHQQRGRPNLEIEEKKRAKLAKESQTIKSRISFLQNSSRELENQGESKLKQLRLKGDELSKQKLANEKVISEATYKLNQYMKQFPDHQKKKQEAKNEQKRRKQEARDRAKEEQKKKSILKKQKEKEQVIEELTSSDWPLNTNQAVKDNGSFLNNKQIQLGGILAVVIIIIGLSYI